LNLQRWSVDIFCFSYRYEEKLQKRLKKEVFIPTILFGMAFEVIVNPELKALVSDQLVLF